MIVALLLLVLVAAQAPILPQMGTVAGSLRLESGLPATGIRVGVRSADPVDDDVLYGLSVTDSSGNFVLENVPPGRYHIVAGSVGRPTYYPGTAEPSEASVILVGPGSALSAIDFTVMEKSITVDNSRGMIRRQSVVTLPITVQVEDAEALPAEFEKAILQFITAAGRVAETVALQQKPGLAVALLPGGYRVVSGNLPPGYVVKSAIFRAKDLTKETYGFSESTMAVGLRVVSFSGAGNLQDAVDRAAQQVATDSNTIVVTIGLAQP